MFRAVSRDRCQTNLQIELPHIHFTKRRTPQLDSAPLGEMPITCCLSRSNVHCTSVCPSPLSDVVCLCSLSHMMIPPVRSMMPLWAIVFPSIHHIFHQALLRCCAKPSFALSSRMMFSCPCANLNSYLKNITGSALCTYHIAAYYMGKPLLILCNFSPNPFVRLVAFVLPMFKGKLCHLRSILVDVQIDLCRNLNDWYTH